MSHALLTGRVSHSRLRPRAHAFAYRLFMLRLDLDQAAALNRPRRLIGVTRRRLLRFEPGDFMGVRRDLPAPARLAALRQAVVEALVAHGVHAAVVRVEAIAHARIAGYQFNPVSFFCAYDAAGALLGVVADVHNTFGERHAYVLTAAAATAAGHWAEKKVFHVSPFFTLDGSYRFALNIAPGRRGRHSASISSTAVRRCSCRASRSRRRRSPTAPWPARCCASSR